jgi:hypothetical protein
LALHPRFAVALCIRALHSRFALRKRTLAILRLEYCLVDIGVSSPLCVTETLLASRLFAAARGCSRLLAALRLRG